VPIECWYVRSYGPRPLAHIQNPSNSFFLATEDDVEVAMVDHQTGDKKRFTFDYVARAHTTQACEE
jgi:hypothetical protein